MDYFDRISVSLSPLIKGGTKGTDTFTSVPSYGDRPGTDRDRHTFNPDKTVPHSGTDNRKLNLFDCTRTCALFASVPMSVPAFKDRSRASKTGQKENPLAVSRYTRRPAWGRGGRAPLCPGVCPSGNQQK